MPPAVEQSAISNQLSAVRQQPRELETPGVIVNRWRRKELKADS
jgi:hypothetical protein